MATPRFINGSVFMGAFVQRAFGSTVSNTTPSTANTMGLSRLGKSENKNSYSSCGPGQREAVPPTTGIRPVGVNPTTTKLFYWGCGLNKETKPIGAMLLVGLLLGEIGLLILCWLPTGMERATAWDWFKLWNGIGLILLCPFLWIAAFLFLED